MLQPTSEILVQNSTTFTVFWAFLNPGGTPNHPSHEWPWLCIEATMVTFGSSILSHQSPIFFWGCLSIVNQPSAQRRWSINLAIRSSACSMMCYSWDPVVARCPGPSLPSCVPCNWRYVKRWFSSIWASGSWCYSDGGWLILICDSMGALKSERILFDDAAMRQVYLGPSQGAKTYFTSMGFEMPDSETPGSVWGWTSVWISSFVETWINGTSPIFNRQII